MRWDEIVKTVGAAVSAFMASFFGSWNPMLTALAIVIFLDYITGLMVASEHKSLKTEGGGLSSQVGFDGLKRKGFIVVMVLVGAAVDYVTGTSIFKNMVAGYYFANESISILENAKLMGVKYPEKLMNALEVMRDENDKEDKSKATDAGKE